jgi:hypothetical protein
VCFQCWVSGCFLVQQEGKINCTELSRGRVYGCSQGYLVEKITYGTFGQGLEPTIIHCDNQSCIKLSENPLFHDHSKHIEIKDHHIKDCVPQGKIKLHYLPTGEQTTNILTNALPRSSFVYFRDKLGVMQNTFLSKREC